MRTSARAGSASRRDIGEPESRVPIRGVSAPVRGGAPPVVVPKESLFQHVGITRIVPSGTGMFFQGTVGSESTNYSAPSMRNSTSRGGARPTSSGSSAAERYSARPHQALPGGENSSPRSAMSARRPTSRPSSSSSLKSGSTSYMQKPALRAAAPSAMSIASNTQYASTSSQPQRPTTPGKTAQKTTTQTTPRQEQGYPVAATTSAVRPRKTYSPDTASERPATETAAALEPVAEERKVELAPVANPAPADVSEQSTAAEGQPPAPQEEPSQPLAQGEQPQKEADSQPENAPAEEPQQKEQEPEPAADEPLKAADPEAQASAAEEDSAAAPEPEPEPEPQQPAADAVGTEPEATAPPAQ